MSISDELLAKLIEWLTSLNELYTEEERPDLINLGNIAGEYAEKLASLTPQQPASTPDRDQA